MGEGLADDAAAVAEQQRRVGAVGPDVDLKTARCRGMVERNDVRAPAPHGHTAAGRSSERQREGDEGALCEMHRRDAMGQPPKINERCNFNS